MRLPIIAFGFFVACTCAVGSRAEIVIDDFDDPITIVLPQMENQSVMTPGVGVLNADRFIDVSSSQTDPIGLVDVAITRPSHLTARIDGQFLDNPLNTPILDINIGYDFGIPTDLTDNGANNAMFIDMAIFQGSGIPSSLLLTGIAGNGGFFAGVSRFSLLSDSPYTITMPFSSFGPRGGGEPADASTVERLGIRIRLLQGSTNPDTNWFVQIDRIRVGSVVPEPGTGWLAILAALILAAIGARRY